MQFSKECSSGACERQGSADAHSAWPGAGRGRNGGPCDVPPVSRRQRRASAFIHLSAWHSCPAHTVSHDSSASMRLTYGEKSSPFTKALWRLNAAWVQGPPRRPLLCLSGGMSSRGVAWRPLPCDTGNSADARVVRTPGCSCNQQSTGHGEPMHAAPRRSQPWRYNDGGTLVVVSAGVSYARSATSRTASPRSVTSGQSSPPPLGRTSLSPGHRRNGSQL